MLHSRTIDLLLVADGGDWRLIFDR